MSARRGYDEIQVRKTVDPDLDVKEKQSKL